MKRKYEQLALTPIAASTEESVLYSSGEKTECLIEPMTVKVTGFDNATEEWKELTFDAK